MTDLDLDFEDLVLSDEGNKRTINIGIVVLGSRNNEKWDPYDDGLNPKAIRCLIERTRPTGNWAFNVVPSIELAQFVCFVDMLHPVDQTASFDQTLFAEAARQGGELKETDDELEPYSLFVKCRAKFPKKAILIDVYDTALLGPGGLPESIVPTGEWKLSDTAQAETVRLVPWTSDWTQGGVDEVQEQDCFYRFPSLHPNIQTRSWFQEKRGQWDRGAYSANLATAAFVNQESMSSIWNRLSSASVLVGGRMKPLDQHYKELFGCGYDKKT